VRRHGGEPWRRAASEVHPDHDAPPGVVLFMRHRPGGLIDAAVNIATGLAAWSGGAHLLAAGVLAKAELGHLATLATHRRQQLAGGDAIDPARVGRGMISFRIA
jgi:hypothetical protein